MTEQTETIDQLTERIEKSTPIEKAQAYTNYFFQNKLEITEEDKIFDALQNLQWSFPETDTFFDKLQNKVTYTINAVSKDKRPTEKYKRFSQKVFIFSD